MAQPDWNTITNWIISGFIGVLMGAISGWITYRYQRKLDNDNWKRELEYRKREEIRKQLTYGTNCSPESIKLLADSLKEMRSGLILSSTVKGLFSSSDVDDVRYIAPGESREDVSFVLIQMYEKTIENLEWAFTNYPSYLNPNPNPPIISKPKSEIEENLKKYTEYTEYTEEERQDNRIMLKRFEYYINDLIHKYQSGN